MGKQATFSDTKYLGNPSKTEDRQFASSGGDYVGDGVNIADKAGGPTADIYMVPAFQGMSGQGANQSTDRPKGSS